MEISLAAEKVAHLGPIPITNSMILSWIASILLIVFALSATRKIKMIPQGIQNVFEVIVEFLYGMFNNVFEDEKQTKRFFPLLATFFLFILFNNWLGTLPGVGSIGIMEEHKGVLTFIPLLRPGNADLNHTLALAVVSVIAIQFFGIIGIGLFKYGGKFLNFKGPIDFFVSILELIGEISKLLSFSFRLFGNIFAGEVLLTVIMSIAPYIAPIPFTFLEIFVGLIQALVFTMLSSVFIKIATTSHEEHEKHVEREQAHA